MASNNPLESPEQSNLFKKNIMNRKSFLLLFVSLIIFSAGSIVANAQNQTFTPSGDAFVRGGAYSAENYHNHPDGLYVKQGNVINFFRKAFVKFDISEYNLEQVGTAKLRLFCYRLEKPEEQSSLNA